MADRPRDPADGGYGWLYGDEDDESTRRIPTAPRDRRRPAAPPPRDSDATRVMPTHGGPGGPARRGPGDGHGRGAPPPPRPPRPPRSSVPPPRGAPPPRSARRSTRPRWGRIILLALLAWIVFLVAVPVWAVSQIDDVDAEPRDSRPDNTLGTTYLLVGSDSRRGLSGEERRQLSTGNAEGQRTDTILLLHEPAFGGQTLLVSLPRDSIVDVPGHGTTKLNAAFAFGGPRLLVRTVENETDLYVDDYVEVGIGGFVNVVDAVGGVEICPKTAMNDPLAGLNIKRGCQDADGPTALGYVRSRHLAATGDIDRGRRQREVLGQVAAKAASPWTFINPFRYFALNNAGAQSIRVGKNVGPIDLARLAWAMHKVSGDGGRTCTVPIADLAVNWDDERADALFERIREGDTEDVGPRLCSKTGLPR